mmetsp:Transcript_78319/g.217525  ORF Transcript_78319/g.217525 Transcript_78319/m.217525 type:complete len:347 (-) Transcript_78319:1043-2083(-)
MAEARQVWPASGTGLGRGGDPRSGYPRRRRTGLPLRVAFPLGGGQQRRPGFLRAAWDGACRCKLGPSAEGAAPGDDSGAPGRGRGHRRAASRRRQASRHGAPGAMHELSGSGKLRHLVSACARRRPRGRRGVRRRCYRGTAPRRSEIVFGLAHRPHAAGCSRRLGTCPCVGRRRGRRGTFSARRGRNLEPRGRAWKPRSEEPGRPSEAGREGIKGDGGLGPRVRLPTAPSVCLGVVRSRGGRAGGTDADGPAEPIGVRIPAHARGASAPFLSSAGRPRATQDGTRRKHCHGWRSARPRGNAVAEARLRFVHEFSCTTRERQIVPAVSAIGGESRKAKDLAAAAAKG